MRYRVREDDVEWRQVGEEVVILDVRAARYFSVNGSGTVLWPLLAGGVTTDGMVSELVRAFGVDGATARRDIEAFIGALLERGLVDVAGDGA